MATPNHRRGPRRTSSTERAEAYTETRGREAGDPVASVHSISEQLLARDEAVRRGEYEYLGYMKHIRLAQRDADHKLIYLKLRKSGPGLGRMRDGSLSILGPWLDLPDLPNEDQGACPDCRAKCQDCAGKGKRLCLQPWCGGRGKIATPGTAEAEQKTCELCKGTGQSACALCEGSGMMSTGYKDGARHPGSFQDPPLCATCRGQRRVFRALRQDIGRYVVARMEGYDVVGPVEAIGFMGDEHTAEQVGSVEAQPDLDGVHMMLLLSKAADGAQRAWLWGGMVRPAAQQMSA